MALSQYRKRRLTCISSQDKQGNILFSRRYNASEDTCCSLRHQGSDDPVTRRNCRVVKPRRASGTQFRERASLVAYSQAGKRHRSQTTGSKHGSEAKQRCGAEAAKPDGAERAEAGKIWAPEKYRGHPAGSSPVFTAQASRERGAHRCARCKPGAESTSHLKAPL